MAADALVNDDLLRHDSNRNSPALLAAIRAARDGDGAAFEELMVLSERRVAQVAWAILGDREEVKEATQETFLRLFRHLRRYDETRDFFAWLTRVTVNVSRDLLRRRNKHVSVPLEDVEVASGERRADDELARRDDLALLRRAVDALAPKERMAVILRDIEGLPTEDVAAALGNTVATVRVQLSRARVKIRNFVDAVRGSRR
jgi:RNA polymerase sigma-70 factor (ECF subfamily)